MKFQNTQKRIQKYYLMFLKLDPRCFSGTFFLDILRANKSTFSSEPVPEISKQTLKLKYSYEKQDLLRETEMGGLTLPSPNIE